MMKEKPAGIGKYDERKPADIGKYDERKPADKEMNGHFKTSGYISK